MGLPEIEIAKYIRRFVEVGAICVDVGAALGYYTMALGRLSRSGTVIAFESQQDSYLQLKTTVEHNHHVGSTFDIRHAHVGTSLTLDAELRDARSRSRIAFIKIDVEGGEHDVLQGAAQTLQLDRPRVIVEVHSTQLESLCIHLLEEQDYYCRKVSQQMFWPEFRPLEHNQWVVAVHCQDRLTPWLRSIQTT